MAHDHTALATLWREHAALLRRYGAEAQAAVLDQCAAELEAGHRERVAARVGLEEAIELTGFSRSHLRRLWREGVKVRKLGTEENPEFYLYDLPRKPGYMPENKRLARGVERHVNSRKQVARAIVKGED